MLGMEPRVSFMLGKHSDTELHLHLLKSTSDSYSRQEYDSEPAN
jgi:hypothetical protein